MPNEATTGEDTPPGPGHDHAGLISRLCLVWVNPLIQLASQRSLKLSDLWPLDASAGAAVLVPRFERAWAVQLLKPAGKRSLSAALGSMFWPTLVVTVRVSLGAESVTIDDIDACRLYECAMGVQLTSYVTADTKAAAVKVTETVKHSTPSYTGGHCMTLMASDSQKLPDSALIAHTLWTSPLYIAVAMYSLIKLVGMAARALSSDVALVSNTQALLISANMSSTATAVASCSGAVRVAKCNRNAGKLQDYAVKNSKQQLQGVHGTAAATSATTDSDISSSTRQHQFELHLDFTAQPSELIAVVGSVATGKSALISAILNDMTRMSGSVTVNGSIAYVAQTAFICNMTLRDNILFGAHFDQERYNA
eukprot:2745-Heterococcus_DN1.PRE.3